MFVFNNVQDVEVENSVVTISSSIKSNSPLILSSLNSVQEIPFSQQSVNQRETTKSLEQPLSSTIPIEEEILSYDPSMDYERCELILIVDGREKNSKPKKDVVENLKKINATFQLRPLSIGDYLWVLKMNNPNRKDENDEMVLDYVIERKTWDDLKVFLSFKKFQI